MTKHFFSPRITSILAWLLFVVPAAGISASAQKDLTIAQIQGDKAKSPYENQQVRVQGIVTARNRNGIFIQTPDGKTDNDPATSEGIYVFLGANSAYSGDIGDLVEVSGTVQEFMPRSESFGFTTTEIGRADVKKISAKNPLPAPITLTANDLVPNKVDTLERYEGMRVRVDALTVTGPTGGRTDEKTWVTTSDGVFFGTLPGVPRPVREAGAEIFVAIGLSLPNTVSMFDTNPEMLRIDSDALGGKPIDVTAGATVKNIVGVMDYGYRHYTLLVDPATPPTVEGMKAFTPVSAAGDRELTIVLDELDFR